MRELEQIEADITHERAWQRIEERLCGGHDHPEVAASNDRIDALLEERAAVVRALQGEPPCPVDARLVQRPQEGR